MIKRVKSDISKTLVLRLSSIGDILLATPFLRALRRSYPHARIDVAVRAEYADLLRHHPAVSVLHEIDVREGRAGLARWRRRFREERYDTVFDLHNVLRTRLLRRGIAPRVRVLRKYSLRRALLVRAGINLLAAAPSVPERYIACAAADGLEPDDRGPEIFLPAKLEEELRRRVLPEDAGNARLIGICPGARHTTKRWPLEHFEELCRLLLHVPGARIAVFGGADDRDAGETLARLDPASVHNYCGALTLLETAAAMRSCDVAVTNDSGLMHMACACAVPVVALFGSTVREFGFFPYQSASVVLETSGLRCRPCTHVGRSDCPRGHFRCMRDIHPQDVVSAVRGFLLE